MPCRLPLRAQQQLFAVALDIARADDWHCCSASASITSFIDEAGGGQAIRPRRHVILALKAADGVDLGDALACPRSCGRITQSCSVRRSSGVHSEPSGFVAPCFGLDRVHEDFAEAGGDGAQSPARRRRASWLRTACSRSFTSWRAK